MKCACNSSWFVKLFGLVVLAAAVISLSGCLTTEYKEYRMTLNEDGSGKGKVRFYNIMSQLNSEYDSVSVDYQELITSYIEGQTFEADFPEIVVTRKELFEENGVLVGEIEFTFPNLAAFGLYQYKNGPIMFYASEAYDSSNGTYPEVVPAVIWDAGTKDLYLKTTVAGEVTGDSTFTSMLPSWQKDKRK